MRTLGLRARPPFHGLRGQHRPTQHHPSPPVPTVATRQKHRCVPPNHHPLLQKHLHNLPTPDRRSQPPSTLEKWSGHRGGLQQPEHRLPPLLSDNTAPTRVMARRRTRGPTRQPERFALPEWSVLLRGRVPSKRSHCPRLQTQRYAHRRATPSWPRTHYNRCNARRAVCEGAGVGDRERPAQRGHPNRRTRIRLPYAAVVPC
mmetsp:Transcript_42983/g.69844  ORF Transcript_42983/g.69844 Transcript_42983/m.69844 type:complete len:202 (-) Transcript_42983:3125-3730(-)